MEVGVGQEGLSAAQRQVLQMYEVPFMCNLLVRSTQVVESSERHVSGTLQNMEAVRFSLYQTHAKLIQSRQLLSRYEDLIRELHLVMAF
jgi:hypothetical protein